MHLIPDLVKKEGWVVRQVDGQRIIEVEGEMFPYVHPVLIHLKLYRESKNPETKYLHMKAAHDYLWPKALWHYWTERRFREHCEGWSIITLAGGASTAKSYDVAKIAAMYWFANPKGRNVTIASVTLESLATRVWGYLTRLIDTTAVEMPYKYYKAAPPKFLYERPKNDKRFKIEDDTLHGIFSVTARKGDDDNSISTWIGKHPDDGMLLILDEATDMPTAILKALPNLKTKGDKFQLIAIGNSNSKFDLHGSLSTPKLGWKSIDPKRDFKWETMQERGICLYFSPYESPAVLEPDPVRRAELGKFLITKEQLESKEKELGKNSEGFWRFVLGFWKDDGIDKVVMSKKFLDEYDPSARPHWSGMYPIRKVAGLDVAYSSGGDQVILQVGAMGHTVDGSVKIWFNDHNWTYRIPIYPQSPDSAELQIAKETLKLLTAHGIPLSALAVDSTGQGRAQAEVIKLQANTMEQPWKIYTTQIGGAQVRSFDVQVITSLELWMTIREFVQHSQVCGLSDIAILQLTTRLIEEKNGKQVLESKAKFKTRMGAIMPSMARSPDEADAIALCLQAAVRKYGFAPGMEWGLTNEIHRNMVDEKLSQHLINQEREDDPNRKLPNITADFSSSVEDLVVFGNRLF